MLRQANLVPLDAPGFVVERDEADPVGMLEPECGEVPAARLGGGQEEGDFCRYLRPACSTAGPRTSRLNCGAKRLYGLRTSTRTSMRCSRKWYRSRPTW
jgi:hypothetical protein